MFNIYSTLNYVFGLVGKQNVQSSTETTRLRTNFNRLCQFGLGLIKNFIYFYQA